MRNMYFIGVTTGQSAINRMFPEWCKIAHCGECALIGIDIPVGAQGQRYRDALARIRDDPYSAGALVTTHKIAVVQHTADLFSEWSEDARELGEVSCIVSRQGKLAAHALDVECSGFALSRIFPADSIHGRDAVILGAGGAGKALAVHLRRAFPDVSVTITDISADRLKEIGCGRTVLTEGPEANDAVVRSAGDGAIVVNATGLGKDLPGSPLTGNARFPRGAVAWDLNYRGNLKFLELARAQGVREVDGWDYFVRGWSTTMSHVLEFELTAELFDAFSRAALPTRPTPEARTI